MLRLSLLTLLVLLGSGLTRRVTSHEESGEWSCESNSEIQAVHDGNDVFFLLQVDGDYAYTKGDNAKCPSVALMFQIGDDATYHDMGGCKEPRDSCTNKTCKGHEVDIMHFSIGNAIPGRLYGGNPIDNRDGNGGDRFGHLVDVYAWNPHCRYLDGMGPSDENDGTSFEHGKIKWDEALKKVTTRVIKLS
ncbi:hypothetical protein GOBAR_DD13515 [Gossypium barbadense]|nr:hypothetical protein GOBAR_DD13515 [Gossypium barbadense]